MRKRQPTKDLIGLKKLFEYLPDNENGKERRA